MYIDIFFISNHYYTNMELEEKFQELITYIGENLKKLSLQNLCSYYGLQVDSSKDVKQQGVDVMQSLVANNTISSTNIPLLEFVLIKLERNDLLKKLEQYKAQNQVEGLSLDSVNIKKYNKGSRDPQSVSTTVDNDITVNQTLINKAKNLSHGCQEYDMSSENCGKCVIINNETFDGKDVYTTRTGSKRDVERLSKLFEWLNFSVYVHQNVNKKDMLSILEEESKDKSKVKDSCFVLIILSHGSEDNIITSDGKEFSIQEVIDMFKADKCCSLKRKPKLFFIQACQGTEFSQVVKIKSNSEKKENAEVESTSTENDNADQQNMKKDDVPKLSHIVAEADQYLFLSAIPGTLSWRNSLHGSWFIQALCDVFEQDADTKTLYELTLAVNNKIASKCGNSFGGMIANMMSCIGAMTLTKQLKFKPKDTFRDFCIASGQATSALPLILNVE